MLGRAIEKLIEGQYAPGHYRVEWNARTFSSGTYVYRIEAGDFVATRKLVILR